MRSRLPYALLMPSSVILARTSRITLFQLENRKGIFSVRCASRIGPVKCARNVGNKTHDGRAAPEAGSQAFLHTVEVRSTKSRSWPLFHSATSAYLRDAGRHDRPSMCDTRNTQRPDNATRMKLIIGAVYPFSSQALNHNRHRARWVHAQHCSPPLKCLLCTRAVPDAHAVDIDSRTHRCINAFGVCAST